MLIDELPAFSGRIPALREIADEERVTIFLLGAGDESIQQVHAHADLVLELSVGGATGASAPITIDVMGQACAEYGTVHAPRLSFGRFGDNNDYWDVLRLLNNG